jgi:HAMP domain-containing protein
MGSQGDGQSDGPLTRLYQQRMAGARIIIRLGIGGATLAGAGNLFLYFQNDAWQMLFVAIAELANLLALLISAWILFGRKGSARPSPQNQRPIDIAGFIILGCVWIGLGAGELAHAGLTPFLSLGGVLLIVIVSSLILPGRWTVSVALSILYVVYIVLVNLFPPVPRYDVAGPGGATLVFRIFISLIILSMVIVGFWQFFRLLRQATIRTRLRTIFVILALLPLCRRRWPPPCSALAPQQQDPRPASSPLGPQKAENRPGPPPSNQYPARRPPQRSPLSHLLLTEPAGADMAVYRNVYDQRARPACNRSLTRATSSRTLHCLSDGIVRLSTDAAHLSLNEQGYPYFEAGLLGLPPSPPSTLPTHRHPYHGRRRSHARCQRPNHCHPCRPRRPYLSLQHRSGRSGLGQTGETPSSPPRPPPAHPSIDPTFVVQGPTSFSEASTRQPPCRETLASSPATTRPGRPWRLPPPSPTLILSSFAEQTQAESLVPTLQAAGINLGLTAGAVLVAVLAALFVTNRITTPIANLADLSQRIAAGAYHLQAPVEQQDEIGDLARSFNDMTARLRTTLASLEDQVAERTAALTLRTAYLQASAEVGQAHHCPPDQLIQQVVDPSVSASAVLSASSSWTKLANTPPCAPALVAGRHVARRHCLRSASA